MFGFLKSLVIAKSLKANTKASKTSAKKKINVDNLPFLSRFSKMETKGHAIWQIVIFLFIAYTAIEVPLTYIKHQKDVKNWQLIFDGIMTAIFALDIFINFTHQASNEKEFHMHQLQGYHDYKRSFWLPLDILACIPFDILVYSLDLPVDANLFRLLRLIKLIRVVKVISILSSMSYLPKSFKISAILVSVSVIIHWVACGWITFGDPVMNSDFGTQYNLALYWTVTTLTTIGYGDITPSTNLGRFYTMIIMLLGVGVYGVVIGSISKIIVSSSRHKERLKERMQDLSMLMKHYEVPRKVQSEVFSYYHGMAKKRLTDNDQKLISELPTNLRNELEVYMVLKLVSGIPLFEGLKLRELKHVARFLQQEFYSPGETIIHKGDKGDKMFIISNGSVSILNQNDEIINTLQSGQFFGEIALMMDMERGANVEAKSYCDVYTLNKANFEILVDKYESLKKNISKVMVRRKSDNDKTDEDSENSSKEILELEEKVQTGKTTKKKITSSKKTTKKKTSTKKAA